RDHGRPRQADRRPDPGHRGDHPDAHLPGGQPRVNRLRVLLPSAAVVLASVGAAGWLLFGADRAVAVTPPKTDAKTEAACAGLQRHLPATVAGQARDTTSP